MCLCFLIEADGHIKAHVGLMDVLLLLNVTLLLSGVVAQYCLEPCFVCQVSVWLYQRQLSLGRLPLIQPQ